MNPTIPIAFLGPGHRLVLHGIHITTGQGRTHGSYSVAHRAAFSHLDIPQHGRDATHEPDGAAADDSGYKVSSLVANPRHHRLTYAVPATANVAEAVAVAVDACAHIYRRLELIAGVIEGAAQVGAAFTVGRGAAGLEEGVLTIPSETFTVGELICRAVHELEPTIAFAAYTVSSHNDILALTVRHAKGVAPIVLEATRHCQVVFDTLRTGIRGARIGDAVGTPWR